MNTLNRTPVYFVIMLLFLASSFSMTSQSTAQSSNDLDIVFALDTTSSMYRNLTNWNDFSRIEQGLRVIYDDRSNGVPLPSAIDPLDYRLEATTFILNWIKNFNQEQSTTLSTGNVRVGIVGFTQNIQTVLTLTAISDLTPETLANLTLEQPSSEASADFINLYEGLASSDWLGGTGNQRKLLIMVTDSIPCNTNNDPTQVNGEFVRDVACSQFVKLGNHLEVASQTLDSSVTQVVYHLLPNEYWNDINENDLNINLLNIWERAIGNDNGNAFVNLNLNTLPQKMFETVLNEFTFANFGIRDPQLLGIIKEESANFDVPPYQAAMDVILFATSDNTPAFASSNDNDVPSNVIIETGNRRAKVIRFDRPDSGRWRFIGSPPIWVSYVPASAQVSIENLDRERNTFYQYDRVQLVYSLLANDIALYDDKRIPDITLSLSTPSGIVTLDVLNNGRDFRSEPYVLLEEGDYNFDIRVVPADDWELNSELPDEGSDDNEGEIADNNTALFNYRFLQVQPPATITVDPMLFAFELGDESQQRLLSQNQSLSIFRNVTLPLRISANVNGTTIAVPEIASASLASEGTGCLSDQSDGDLTRVNDVLMANAIPFEAGECHLTARLTVNSPDKPLSNQEQTIETQSLGMIDVQRTERLRVFLLDRNNQPIEQDFDVSTQIEENQSKLIHFTMLDRQDIPNFLGAPGWVYWQSNTLTFDIIFRSDNDRPVNPVFIQESTIDGESLIPFEVDVIPLSGDGSALSKGISLIKSEATGVYTLTITDLVPDDYQINIRLLTGDPYRLEENYEYDQSVLARQLEETFELVAFLRVEANPSIPLQIWGTIAIVGLLILYILYTLIHRYLQASVPLSGALAIYRLDNGQTEEIWRKQLPPIQQSVNSYTYNRKEISNPETNKIVLRSIEATTKRDKDFANQGGVYVNLEIDKTHTGDMKLRQGEPQEFENGYYIVKLESETASVPIFNE